VNLTSGGLERRGGEGEITIMSRGVEGALLDGDAMMDCCGVEAALEGSSSNPDAVSHRKSTSSSVQMLSARAGARKLTSPLPEGLSSIGWVASTCDSLADNRSSIICWFLCIFSRQSFSRLITSPSVRSEHNSTGIAHVDINK
jgi:hypothetical protein